MSNIYRDLINSTINKIKASVIKPKRPYVPVFLNGHKVSALYDTGADICCMSSSYFRKYFPVGKRPTKLQRKSDLKAASGNKLVSEGIYPKPFTIDGRRFEHNVHVFSNLNEGMILGIDFLSKHGLGLDPSSAELYWTDKSTANWHHAKLQCSEQITINPTTNKMVTLNVLMNEEDSESQKLERPSPSSAVRSTLFKEVQHWYESISWARQPWKSSIVQTV
jgi:hypothetical protein